MTNKVTKAVELIYAMDNEELNQVVEAIKLKRQYLVKQTTRSLMVGDIVSFTSSRTGRDLSGKVIKVARKYVTINCGVDGQWKVPGNMLTKLGIGA